MLIVFEHDDLIECDKCEGNGVIPVDLWEHFDTDFLVTRSYSWQCGVCDGEGKLMPTFQFDLADND